MWNIEQQRRIFENKSRVRIHRDCPFNERPMRSMHKFHLVVLWWCKRQSAWSIPAAALFSIILRRLLQLLDRSILHANDEIQIYEKMVRSQYARVPNLFCIYCYDDMVEPKPIRRPYTAFEARGYCICKTGRKVKRIAFVRLVCSCLRILIIIGFICKYKFKFDVVHMLNAHKWSALLLRVRAHTNTYVKRHLKFVRHRDNFVRYLANFWSC